MAAAQLNPNTAAIRRGVANLLLILIFGGAGGVVLDRLILPRLAAWPLLKNWNWLNPTAPLVVTKRETIRINEGINHAELSQKLKSVLAAVFVHEGDFNSPKFRVLESVSGVVVGSDGIIVVPQLVSRPGAAITVLLSDQSPQEARVLTTDSLTGITFLKISAQNLPVLKQNSGGELFAGEKVLIVSASDDPASPVAIPASLLKDNVLSPSPLTLRDLKSFTDIFSLDVDPAAVKPGAVVVDKDGAMTGLLTRPEGKPQFLPTSVFKLVADKFLAGQKINWPKAAAAYRILNAEQAGLFDLPSRFGVLIKTGPPPLLENDFIYALDGFELGPKNDFQLMILRKETGTKVKFNLVRASVDLELIWELP